jgi:hypothetical protein
MTDIDWRAIERMLSRERGAERTYHELHVRSETGIGAA